MAELQDSMLLKFRAVNSRFGVTRETVRSLATELDTTETAVVHLALSKLATELLPAYEADDGPLTARQLAAVKRAAKAALPKGAVVGTQKLF